MTQVKTFICENPSELAEKIQDYILKNYNYKVSCITLLPNSDSNAIVVFETK